MTGSSRNPIPVIVGVGEITHRDDDDPAPAEPLALILAAARAADEDAGGGVLELVDALELMPVGSWPYDDLGCLVAERLSLTLLPARRAVHPTGGETPLRAVDGAAARIAAGASRAVLIAGAEGTRAATRARRAGTRLPWTPAGTPPSPGAFARGFERAFAVGIERALDCFPLYEHALRAHEGSTYAHAEHESAVMWSGLSRVAVGNPYAWTRVAADERDVVAVNGANRMVSFPYTKAMTANPFVNQGAALVMTDTETARTLGVPEERWVYPLGGAGADEPADPRTRVAYHRVPALEATVTGIQEVTGIAVGDVEAVELYSCFPAMPKLSRRALGRADTDPISVTGGLSFFGGPGSNYLTHSLAAMVRRIRARGGTGLLHGVGMYNTKHHALVLGDHEREDGTYPPPPHGVGEPRPPVETPVAVVEGYEGPGTVETFSVLFDRVGTPVRGVVIGRGVRNERFAARVDVVGDTLAVLTSGSEAVGLAGTVSAGDIPEFRF